MKYKVIFVGDHNAGKTCLIIRMIRGPSPSENPLEMIFMPTVYENVEHEFVTPENNRLVILKIFDTAGSEEYARLRPLAYNSIVPWDDLVTAVVVICFAVNDIDRLENVEEAWIPEVRQYLTDVPIILVGCKTDLRTTDASLSVSTEEGEALADKTGAVKYMECSADTYEGIEEVTCAIAILAAQTAVEPRKKIKCVLA